MLIAFRGAQPDHAAAFLRLQNILAHETSYLLLTPDEVSQVSLKMQIERIESINAKTSEQRLYFAFDDRDIVGYLGYMSVPLVRVRHVVEGVAIAVHPAYRRCGIATGLLGIAEDDWNTRLKAIVRAKVRVDNQPSLRLFQASGFKIEWRECASIHDKIFVDCYVLTKRIAANIERIGSIPPV